MFLMQSGQRKQQEESQGGTNNWVYYKKKATEKFAPQRLGRELDTL